MIDDASLQLLKCSIKNGLTQGVAIVEIAWLVFLLPKAHDREIGRKDLKAVLSCTWMTATFQ